MNIIDAVIILFLLCGAVLGFKRGVIKSVVSFVGTIICIILAYLLKNPLSALMYTYLPFFKFSGAIQNVTVFNIFIYEGVAFLVLFAVLSALLKFLIKVSGLMEALLKSTVILSIPSKILGAIFGLFSYFIILFVILFAVKSFNFAHELMDKSKGTNAILEKTPILSNFVGDAFNSFKEIYDLKDKYPSAGAQYNLEALDILLKNDVISAKSANKLVEKGKLDNDALPIIQKYEK